MTMPGFPNNSAQQSAASAQRAAASARQAMQSMQGSADSHRAAAQAGFDAMQRAQTGQRYAGRSRGGGGVLLGLMKLVIVLAFLAFVVIFASQFFPELVERIQPSPSGGT